MKGLPLALAAALVASLAFNLVLYRGASEVEARAESQPRGRETASAAAPAPAQVPAGRAGAPADSSQLLAEIRQLRADLAAARGTPPSTAERPPSKKAPEELPPAIAMDPVVMNALAERDATRQMSSKFWRDLDRVYEVKDAIGVPKFREVMSRLTADFLGLDPSGAASFVTASTQAAMELDRAEADRKEMQGKLGTSVTDKETRRRLEEGVDVRYNDQRQAAVARLDPYLHGTPFQLDLKGKSGGRWMEYLRSK